MSFDFFVLSAINQELSQLLPSGRIDRIYQPAKELIVFLIRQQRKNYKLLMSAQAASARIHLTKQEFVNPITPPPFCMLLRKHLERGRITGLNQPDRERILHLNIETPDALGRTRLKTLICEIMGKHSNVILVNPESNQIIDAIKRYNSLVSRHREVLPGSSYIPPPTPPKFDPLTVTDHDFRTHFMQTSLSNRLDQFLTEQYQGFSPEASREVVARAGLPATMQVNDCGDYEITVLWQSFQQIVRHIQNNCWQPTLVTINSHYVTFAALNLVQYEPQVHLHPDSMNDTVDLFFEDRLRQENFNKQQRKLNQALNRELKRCYKKLCLQEETLATAREAEQHKTAGLLIMANIHLLHKGLTSLKAENYLNPNEKLVTVKLDPGLTPSQNAQYYFQKYRKAQATVKNTTTQLAKTREEIKYLESNLISVAQSGNQTELEEITLELVEQGYLKPVTRSVRKQEKPKPLSVLSTDGQPILIGKNNKQNDYITFKLAQDHDLWFHAKDLPGAHVIVKTGHANRIEPATLHEAALLAAYFSKGRASSKVAVDYTMRKNVKKLPGAKPGLVIYVHYQTTYVTPDQEKIATILKNTE